MATCPNCGATALFPSARFCTRCGRRLAGESAFKAVLLLAVSAWLLVVAVRGFRSEGSIARWVWDSGGWVIRTCEILAIAGLWAGMMLSVDRLWRALEHFRETWRRIRALHSGRGPG